MWRDLGLTKRDWDRTPPAARTLLLALRHQVRMMGIRFTAYEKPIADLQQQIATVDDLKAEVDELRERLGQNSANSSKPPSSDPPSCKAKPPAESRGRRRGAQPGHPGKARTLKPEREVDHVIDFKPLRCRRCGRCLLGTDAHPERHQVSEVPPARAEVTEYRRHTLPCSECGTRNKAGWPAGMPRGSFGPRAQALVGYLSGRLGASHRDVVEAVGVLHGLEIGTGSVSAIHRQVSEALAGAVARAQQFVGQQKAQYVDETSWRESRRLKWLWVNASQAVTVLRVLSGRGADEAKQMIEERAKGIITSDRLASSNWLTARRRQICWAHLARDFQALAERGGESAKTGQALLTQVKRLFTLWHELRDGGRSRGAFRQAMKPVQRRVKKLLKAQGPCRQNARRDGSRSGAPKADGR